MYKLIITALALAPLSSAVANSTVQTPAIAAALAPTIDVPPGGSLPTLMNCSTALDKLASDMQTKTVSGVNTVVLIEQQALAEAPSNLGSNGGGFPQFGGDIQLTAGKIAGTSHVASPGATSRKDVTFRFSKVDGKARLDWTYAGKSYGSAVDSCASGYWTAATNKSAIAIKLGPLVSPPE